MAVTVAPITDADAQGVGRFLSTHLNDRLSAEGWAAAIDVPWPVEQPNAGFMLRDGDEIVGVHLAFYADRVIDGRTERFCNLGAWCVLPAYRMQGVRLLLALLAQKGYHFTDLSPSGNVVEVNRRLGFRFLDTATWLVPNLPWPAWPGRTVVTEDPERIAGGLSGEALLIYADHAKAPAARHVLLRRGEDTCCVVFRPDRRRGMRLFATVLHVSDPVAFRRLGRRFACHVLLRHGLPMTLAEDRIVTYRPRPSVRVRTQRRKMFRSPSLDPAQIDDLYSELVCVAW